ERAKEPERVRAERSAARQAPARAAQSELVAHGAVDDEFAESDQCAQARGHRLSVRAQQLRFDRLVAEVFERAALQPRRVGRLYLDLRQQVLPDARRGEKGARAELAQVALHRLRAFRAVAREA